ncbi:MAG TPA: nucleotidyltransferase family protein [Pyrinomonadaceae bacterium]|nr:nucleotidyltransferase family protein [Pyrinomonadaceae bacterium]
MAGRLIPKDHEHENEFLRLCLRPRADQTHLAKTRELMAGKLDWEYLYQLSARHSLVPLVYHQLKQIGSDLVPARFWQRFKSGYQANVARSLVLTNELLSLTRELQMNHIDSLPFKGPVLGSIAYGNPALRCFLDLDIIVRLQDVAATREILRARGYQLASNIDVRQEQLLLNAHHNLQFERDEGRLIVELHWRISGNFYAHALGPEALWARLEPVTLQGAQFNSLPIEDLLLALCIHGSRHFWEKLCWICDLAALITSGRSIDWTRLVSLARETDTEGILLLGLCLASDLAGDGLPEEIRQLIAREERIKRLAGRLSQRLFSGTEHIRLTPHQTFKYSLAMRKSWSARLRYCLFALSPADKDLETLALPRYLNFAYYGLRPFRVMMAGRQNKSQARPT